MWIDVPFNGWNPIQDMLLIFKFSGLFPVASLGSIGKCQMFYLIFYQGFPAFSFLLYGVHARFDDFLNVSGFFMRHRKGDSRVSTQTDGPAGIPYFGSEHPGPGPGRLHNQLQTRNCTHCMTARCGNPWNLHSLKVFGFFGHDFPQFKFPVFHCHKCYHKKVPLSAIYCNKKEQEKLLKFWIYCE